MMQISKTLTPIKGRAALLFLEFVVIVVGVLVALAVDEWRDDVQLAKQRTHILSNLLVDLEEDRYDLDDFDKVARTRRAAAQYLILLAKGYSPAETEWTDSPGEAVYRLAYSARIQPSKGAFMEMVSAGDSMPIVDNELRAKILRYYSLASDRTAVNGFISPQLERFHLVLESLGISATDRDMIDAEVVLADPRASALVRTIGETAGFSSLYLEDLRAANSSLIASIEKALAGERQNK